VRLKRKKCEKLLQNKPKNEGSAKPVFVKIGFANFGKAYQKAGKFLAFQPLTILDLFGNPNFAVQIV